MAPEEPTPDVICAEEECFKPAEKVGLCNAHYQKRWAAGTLPRPAKRPKKAKSTASKVLPRLKHLPSKKRYEEALKLIDNEGWSQRAAAAAAGISRSRLNERIKEREAVAEEAAKMSVAASLERQTRRKEGEDPAPLDVRNELARVPPPDEFLRLYFGGWQCWDCGRPHEWLPFHDEIFRHCTDPAKKRVLINIPPGHGKSTIATMMSTVYEIVKDRNSQTAIMSKTDEMAEYMIGQIRNFLMDPALYDGAARNLVEDFGPFSDGPTLGNAGAFFVTGRQSRERDPTVRAFGLTSHIYGLRAHRIICDDIADTDNQSPEMVESQLRKITQTFQSRIGQSGKLIIVGTRVMPGDIYSRLLELPGYETLRYPCILDEQEELVLFPDHFPFEAAALQRDSMSAEQWNLVYQNSSLPGFGAAFQPEHLEKCHDPDRVIGDVPLGHVRLIAGLDPASAKARGGYTAFVLMAVDTDTGRLYFVDLVKQKQMRAPQMHSQMIDWATRYPLHEFRVETNAVQDQLFMYNDELRSALSRQGCRLTAHNTNRYNKGDPSYGLESMSTYFHNGMISTPWGNIDSRRKFKELDEGFMQVGMTDQTPDLPMAAWFAYSGCREMVKRNSMPMFDPRMNVPPHIRRRRRVKETSGMVRGASFEESAGYSMEQRLMLEEARRRGPVNVAS